MSTSPILASEMHVSRRHPGGRRFAVIFVATVCLSVLLSIDMMLTRRPWVDEGWLASPAYNLLRHGFMGTTILDPHGFPFYEWIKGVDRHTYWVMPGYILFQVAWYALFGFHLFALRAISVLFSIVELCSNFVFVEWLTKSRGVALLATALLATEQSFTLSASTGRMDMMTASLGLLAIALYVKLRERNLDLAFALSGLLLAAAVFTHPNGLFSIIGLSVIILWFDRKGITLKRVALAITPLLVLIAMWGWYISKAPDEFISQYKAQNAFPHRFRIPLHLFSELKEEFFGRFLTYKVTLNSWQSIDALVVFSYVLAVVLAFAVPSIRKRAGVPLLLVITVLHFGLLLCIQKNWYYLIFILPYYTALIALAAEWLWNHGRAAKLVGAAWLILITGINVGVSGMRAYHDDYKYRHLPMGAYIVQHRHPGDLTMGSGDIAFELGFEGEAIDDPRLGYLSGRVPEFIVFDAHYGLWWQLFAQTEPKTTQYINNMLEDRYEVVYDQSLDKNYHELGGFSDFPYRVYRRKHDSETE